MIANERQYKISHAEAERFRQALKEYNELDLIKSGIDPIVARAHKAALAEQLRELEDAIRRYELLREGGISALRATNLTEVGRLLIEGRIARGLSQRALADRLNVKEQQVQRYEQERYQSAGLDRLARVAEALHVEVDLQMTLASAFAAAATNEDTEAFNPTKYPSREMKKRGWLDELAQERAFSSGLVGRQAHEYVSFYTGSYGAALHRKHVRTGGRFSEYALAAWQARIIQKAKREASRKGLPPYQPLDALFVKKLVELSRDDRGPLKAIGMLRERGVIVVVEPHLAETHLDGAALVLDGDHPIIGMTIRYDRLDNFWFTLLHEIGHIVRHRERLKDGFFDDSTAAPEDASEAEADEFANNALIPTEVWKTSFVRFTKSADQVLQFARRLNVGDSVVAGRIRRERGYHLFKSLVGDGCVREMMSEAGLMR